MSQGDAGEAGGEHQLGGFDDRHEGDGAVKQREIHGDDGEKVRDARQQHELPALHAHAHLLPQTASGAPRLRAGEQQGGHQGGEHLPRRVVSGFKSNVR